MLDKLSSARLSALVFSGISLRNFRALEVLAKPLERCAREKFARGARYACEPFSSKLNKRSVTCSQEAKLIALTLIKLL